jgi:hypothetical protein
MARRGRQAALLAALGAGAAGVFGVIFAWPRLVEEYRLWELRREPARFERYFFSADGPEEAAARRFVREPGGREALLALYLGNGWPQVGLTEIRVADLIRGHLSRRSVPGARDAAVGLSPEAFFWLDFTGPPDAARHVSRIALKPADATHVRKILAHLVACVGGRLEIASLPGLEFEVVPVVLGAAAAPSWRERRRFMVFAAYPEVRYVCYFRTMPLPCR